MSIVSQSFHGNKEAQIPDASDCKLHTRILPLLSIYVFIKKQQKKTSVVLMIHTDPYVKVSLMCEGRRLKKRKTSTKRNTLNPVYNEAIVFDVPPENIDQINLSIAVMDYDR